VCKKNQAAFLVGSIIAREPVVLIQPTRQRCGHDASDARPLGRDLSPVAGWMIALGAAIVLIASIIVWLGQR